MNRKIPSPGSEGRGASIPAICQSIDLGRSVDDAFRYFVDAFSSWWPVHRHSISAMRGEGDAASITLEGRVGGQIFEIDGAGEKILWGHVKIFEPPHRIVTSWHPGGDGSEATEVEFRFVATGPATCTVELEHRDWHKITNKPEEARESYANGWTFVLGQLEAAYENLRNVPEEV